MSWPIKINDVVPGVVFEGTTKKGKPQVRQILAIGKLLHFGIQMNEDSCDYLVISGHNVGREGRITRLGMSSWAQRMRLQPATPVVKGVGVEIIRKPTPPTARQ